MHLFFDLDGTLTDSSPGIARTFRHALTALGREEPSDEQLRLCVGPPLAAGFAALLATDDADLIERAIGIYRARYAVEGLFENALYEGVVEGLAALTDDGHTLRLVTAKPQPYAERILQHFGIDRHFVSVHGPSLNDRVYSKGGLLAAALDEAGRPTQGAVMIGDRGEDIRAAREHGVTPVAALWGYGSREELLASNPAHAAASMNDFVRWIQQIEETS